MIVKNKIIEVLSSILTVYAFISILAGTIYLFESKLKNGTPLFALIITILIICCYIKRIEKEENKLIDTIRLYRNLSSLDYSNLKKIEKIEISDNQCGTILLKNGSIKTITEEQIPKTQEELIKLDTNI